MLCSGFVQFCFRHDGDGTLKFASAQSPLGVRLLKTLGLPTETLDRTILLVEGDEVFSQSTAILHSLRHLRGRPRWLVPLRWVPGASSAIRSTTSSRATATNGSAGVRPASCRRPQTRDRFIDL